MRDLDARSVEHCIASGMSSGEALIAEVADASEGQLPLGEKRRLVFESEFAQEKVPRLRATPCLR